MGPLTFHPIYKSRIWGGDYLHKILGRKLPEKERIGESWEIVDRPEAMSVVDIGPMAGYSLRKLVERHAPDVMGPHHAPHRSFPILVKWLDCQERLSLQVHPPSEIATKQGGQPKAENWYILTTAPGSGVLVGLKDNVTRGQLEEALQSGAVEPLIRRQSTQPGDSIFVPSGCLHTIDAGNLILEIQENSDTTYRLYDWGRSGVDGQPRSLHRDDALQSIDFKKKDSVIHHPQPGLQCLVDCPMFRIRKFDLHLDSDPLALPAGEQPRLLHIVEGQVQITTLSSGQALNAIEPVVFEKGRNVLLPFSDSFYLRAVAKKAIVLITDNFCLPLSHDQNPNTL